MSGPAVTTEITGLERSLGSVQALRNALADRLPLHAEMAGTALEMTRGYLRGLNRHRTAQRLGATPVNHYERAAGAIESGHDDAGAVLRIPRRTGLGRAFGMAVVRPNGGRKFLTIPAGPETYGKQAGEWPEDAFVFATIQTHRGPTPVLLWAETAGRHEKGEVAYWLRREVRQEQDRTLLPDDESYRELGRRVIVAHVERLTSNVEL